MWKLEEEEEEEEEGFSVMFKLDDEQKAKINAWAYDHECPITNEGAIGGKITYSFTPNSIGVTEKAVCDCGKELDVTDYESW